MDESTLDNIAEIICGNGESHPIYRSGPHLSGFFSRAGLPHFVHDGSTRQRWVLECLKQCNRDELAKILKRIASPREYGGDKAKIAKAVDRLNEVTYVEGFRTILVGVDPKFEKIEIDYANELAGTELKKIAAPDFLSLNLESGMGDILQSRWTEAQRCVDASAHLAATIMMGSLLEGALLGICRKKPGIANSCASSPKDAKTGRVKQFADWSLADMIDVAHSVGWLGLDVKRFSHALRTFRNLIHPHEQMVTQAVPDADTCNISWLVVQAAVNDLAKALK